MDCEEKMTFESLVTGNDLLLENILGFLPFEDLVSFSLVNKRWFRMCRKELRRNRTCVLRIQSHYPCRQIVKLCQHFEASKQCRQEGKNQKRKQSSSLFKGLRISSYCHNTNQCRGYHVNVNSTVFNWLPINYLDISLNNITNCFAMHLVRMLVRERGADIKELRMCNDHVGRGESLDMEIAWSTVYTRFLRSFEELQMHNENRNDLQSLKEVGKYYDYVTMLRRVEDRRMYNQLDSLEIFFYKRRIPEALLPNLTSLEFKNEFREKFLAAIIPAAPKLKIFRGQFHHNNLPDFLTANKSGLISHFNLSIAHLEQQSQLFLERNPKLQTLSIVQDVMGFPLRLDLAMSFLDVNHASLKNLEIEHFLLILLTPSGQVCLPNLQHMTLHYDGALDAKLGFYSLGKINSELIFPNLNSLEMTSPTGENLWAEKIVEIRSAFGRSREDYIWSSVTNLQIKNLSFSSFARFGRFSTSISSVFPRIRNIKVQSCPDTGNYLEYAIFSWPIKLKSIDLTLEVRPENRKRPISELDSVICGISRKECQYLQNLEHDNPGFFTEFNLVPTAHSLLRVKGLEVLKIKVINHHTPCSAYQGFESEFLSEVSAKLVFARMTDLRFIVTAICNNCKKTTISLVKDICTYCLYA